MASGEWSALRESVVYAEFLLLTTATAFAFNNALTGLDHEGREGSPFVCVQRLLWQLIEGGNAQQQGSSGDPAAPPAVSPSLSLRCSQLAWSLTQLSLRSSAYLHSNAYMVAIAIVFLAASRFGPPAVAAAAAAAPQAPAVADGAAMEDVPVAAAADAATSFPDGEETKTDSNPPSVLAGAHELIDLDVCADRIGWAPRFRVVDAPAPEADGGAPTPLTAPLRWYHALCPTITDALLLSLCEIIVEAALAAPPLPSTPGAGSLAADLQHLADAYPGVWRAAPPLLRMRGPTPRSKWCSCASQRRPSRKARCYPTKSPSRALPRASRPPLPLPLSSQRTEPWSPPVRRRGT